MKRKIIGLGIALTMGLATTIYAERCPNAWPAEGENYASGTIDSTNYSYEVWRDGYVASLECFDNGGYEVYIKAVSSAIVRFGLEFDEPKSFDQFGNFAADYEYDKSANVAGYYFIGIYGVTTEPHIEYYIIDDWRFADTIAAETIFGEKVGEFTVDGDTYDIWQNTANKEPRVQGDMSFKQYFNIRRNTRKSGHIDITAHFKKWEELGMKVGKLVDLKALVEAWSAKNHITFINFSKFEITETADTSSVTPADSTGETTAILRRASLPVLKSDYRVYNMQGRYLGTGEQKFSPAIKTVKKR